MRARPICLIVLLVSLFSALDAKAQNGGGGDPTVAGPLAVSSATYDFGDTAAVLPALPSPVEFRGSVHYPSDLGSLPHPLLVFLHGRHTVCFSGVTVGAFTWPCPAGQSPIPSFQGYAYIAQNLASHGYIVISISADGINAQDSIPDAGAVARAQLIQLHLDLWNTFNTVGGAPFGTLFVGKVDMQKVGTMGHSRGGEGVVRHFLLNQALGSPYGIKAVFPLAPIDFNNFLINNVPLGVLLPYCDGDVKTLEGVHFFDDSRYNVPGDTAPKHTILVMGANHNFFNTVWTPGLFAAGGQDDWTTFTVGGAADSYCGTGATNRRLTPTQQQAAGLAYIAAFLRAYVGGESEFLPLLTGAAPPPQSTNANNIYPSYHAPDSPRFRKDLNRLVDPSGLTTSALGAAIGQSGLAPYVVCGGTGETRPCLGGQALGRQPHDDGFFSGNLGLSQLMTGWNLKNASYTYTLPAGQRNVSAFDAFQFRAGVNYLDGRNYSSLQDLTISMTDGAGNTISVRANDVSPRVLFLPPGSVGPVPKIFLNTVRIPLAAFIGLKLSDVRVIQFRFDQRQSGGIMISDIAFSSPPVVH